VIRRGEGLNMDSGVKKQPQISSGTCSGGSQCRYLRNLTMMTSTPPSQPISTTSRPSRATSWVVAAIAMHLLVTSMASAATTCSETMERTRVTRLSHCVAQAIRELVEQGGESALVVVVDHDPEPTTAVSVAGTICVLSIDRLSPWILSLPPPALA